MKNTDNVVFVSTYTPPTVNSNVAGCSILDYYVTKFERTNLSCCFYTDFVSVFARSYFNIGQLTVVNVSKDFLKNSRSLNSVEQSILYSTFLGSLSSTPKRNNRKI